MRRLGSTETALDKVERDGQKRLLRTFLAVTGVHLGGGVYEARVVIPRWASASTPDEVVRALHESGHVASGRVFWPYTGISLMMLTALNLPVAWRSQASGRRLWLVYTGTMALGTVATIGFFVPTIQKLSRAEHLSSSTVQKLVRRWVNLDRVRLVVGVAGWMAGLTALSQMGESTRAERS